MDNKPDAFLELARSLLRDALQLGPSADHLEVESPLLGEMPEFDSMAVVSLITLAEEQLGIEIPDDELTADRFRTVGSFSGFLKQLSRN